MTDRLKPTVALARIEGTLKQPEIARRVENALRGVMDLKYFYTVLAHLCRRSTSLLQCDPYTIAGSVIEAAAIGLDPAPQLGLVHFVPFYNGKAKRYECQLIPGYRGVITLCSRNPQIRNITARTVQEHDHFEYEYGTGQPREVLIHRPSSQQSDPRHYKAAYALVYLRGDVVRPEVMWRWEIDQIRAQSQAGSRGRGPWASHPDRMAAKTAILRVCKQLPVALTEDEHLVKAAAYDDMVASNMSQGLDVLIRPDAENGNPLDLLAISAEKEEVLHTSPSQPAPPQPTDSLQDRRAPLTEAQEIQLDEWMESKDLSYHWLSQTLGRSINSASEVFEDEFQSSIEAIKAK